MINGVAPKKLGPPTRKDRWDKAFGADDSEATNWKLA